VLTDSQADVGDLLVAMQAIYDEPLADSSNIPTYLISKLARQHVKVVLTGDGGDELLGGYSFWYRPLFQFRKYFWLIRAFRLADKVLTRLSLPSELVWQHRLQGAIYRQDYNSVAEAHIGQKQFFTDGELSRIGLNSMSKALCWRGKYTRNKLDDALRMDLEDYMPGDILVKVDRASMAHGLELRAPFLDVDFASFCIALPARLKVTAEQDKLILRQAFADAWPNSVRSRGKQGFGAPVHQWLKRPSVRALKEQYLNDPGQKLFSLLKFEETQAVTNRDDYQTWALLVLALWMDKHEFKLV
jgi:asparagine synthase (glutamine-hydrolysing)